jgi:hypothetical protein
MQIAQKLEAEEEGKQGDQPATRKDLEVLIAKIEALTRDVHNDQPKR